jgi:sialidase-1
VRLALLLLAPLAAAFAQQGAPPFVAGKDGAHSYRIPSLVATPGGALLVACEARRVTWVDKSPTDIVTRRSLDGGRTWEPVRAPLLGGKGAMMDPCLVADPKSGRILLLAVHWPSGAAESEPNVLLMSASQDDGRTWQKPRRLSGSVLPKGTAPHGLGPGAGIVAADGRIIVPIRLSRTSGGETHVRNHAMTSEDGGANWRIGGAGKAGGEFQFAQAPNGRLVALRRSGIRRMQSESHDLGGTWGAERHRAELGGVEDGCQGSLHRAGQVLLHASPAGATAKPGFDNRGRLTLWRSADNGETWRESAVVHPLASGYSCMANLPDGRVAIVWESGDTPAFVRTRDREPGWMRIDIRLLPKGVCDPSQPLATR